MRPVSDRIALVIMTALSLALPAHAETVVVRTQPKANDEPPPSFETLSPAKQGQVQKDYRAAATAFARQDCRTAYAKAQALLKILPMGYKDATNIMRKCGREAQDAMLLSEDKSNAAFMQLSSEKRKWVVSTYKLSFEAYRENKFKDALKHANEIHNVLPMGYRETKQIIDVSRRKLSDE